MKILNKNQETILKNERHTLNDLLIALVEFNSTPGDQKTLNKSIQQLDELFLLVIVGEFNAGKSAFINALLGSKYLQEGVTPTTTQINILRHGPVQERVVVNDREYIMHLPVDWLSEISIVDTPGTNAIIRTHEEITSQFIPRSDLVLFITSVDRPFTESERQFLDRIHEWGKKVVIIINKIDILQDENEISQVEDFIAENSRNLLRITPKIFSVSSRNALLAKQGDRDVWDQSRFEPLEEYIHDTLDEKGRLRLKFLNPLGVGMHLVDKYLGVISSRLELLAADFNMLTDVEAQLNLYKEDMSRDFSFRMADIENVLFEMEQRGDDYFDETFRLARIFDLLNKDHIRNEFETQVIADTPNRIDQKVDELIDWLVNSDLKQWQAVNDHLAERRRVHKERIVGESNIGTFSYDRERLMEGIYREARRVVETYDKTGEAKSIAEDAQIAVAVSAALEIGAVGLGALVTILATTMVADITGIFLASLIAALGLFVIPARRRLAKAEMREKVSSLRVQLIETLRIQFKKEIDRSVHNISEAIAPYTRFVRAERGKLLASQSELEDIQTKLDKIKGSIEDF